VPRTAVDAALRAGLAHAHAVRHVPTEPELVAAVFQRSLRVLDRSLAAAMAPAQVRISGVFCHGRPLVTASAGWSCELGDLLVLTRETTATPPTNRALLLQVKRGPAPKQVTTPKTQADLYEHWPQFTLYGQTRQVTPAAAHEGAQFSFWETCANADQGCAHCVLDDLIPGLPAFASPLQDELVRAIRQTGGREFDDKANIPAGDVGWSRVIWDLIDQSIGKAWSVAGGQRRGGAWGRSRSWNEGVFLYTADGDIPDLLRGTDAEDAARELFAADHVEPPDDEPPLSPDLGDPDPEGGLPLLFVETAGAAQDGDDELPR
jgi:hypothetical protein